MRPFLSPSRHVARLAPAPRTTTGEYDVGGGLCCPYGTYYGGDGYCYDQ